MKPILLLLTVLIFSCNSSTEKKKVDEAERWKKMEAALDSLFESKIGADEPGVAVLVAYNKNKIFAKGYGVRDIKTREPLTTTTNMEMASVSKQFTALAILSLVNQGKLALSDTVYKFFPFKTFKDVTIKQLLNHTSGIGDAEEFFHSNWDTTKIATNKDVLNWYAEKNRKVDSPGKNFKYNNGAYEVLPVLVEKISGKKYTDFLKENVFEKAGMARTMAYNLNNPVDISERAFYYHKDSLGNWQKMDGHPLTGLSGAGGVYTNLNDYFKYDNSLRDQTIFSKETHHLIFTPSSIGIINGVKKHYAMGWFVTDSLAEHSGGWFGVNTFTRRYFNKPLTLAFFANRDDLSKSRDLIFKTDSIVKVFIKKPPLTRAMSNCFSRLL